MLLKKVERHQGISMDSFPTIDHKFCTQREARALQIIIAATENLFIYTVSLLDVFHTAASTSTGATIIMCILTTKVVAAASSKAAEIKTQQQQQQQQTEQAQYNDLFHLLAIRLRSSSSSSSSPDAGSWEVRQETPHPRAYLHVSRLNWRDYNMNGIHLEAYVFDKQIKSKQAVVALHCESGWPLEFRRNFVPQLSERIRGRLEGWSCYREYGAWKLMMGNSDNDGSSKGMMSVCEVGVPFGASPDETMERVERQLRRLMTLYADIDDVIGNCCCCVQDNDTEEENSSSRLVVLTKEQVRMNDGLEGRPLWTVIDGYVVDCTEFAKFHPGGLRNIRETDEKQTGWTGEEFGFSLTRGSNAHFPKTGRVFEEGMRKFDKLQRQVEVDFGSSDGGAITILGKLLP